MPDSILESSLDELLSEGVPAATQREAATFDAFAEPFGDSIVVFGAGQLGRKIVKCLRESGIEPRCIADNNMKLWGSRIDGLPILSLSDAGNRYGERSAVVAAIWNYAFSFRHVEPDLKAAGFAKIVPCQALLWKYADKLLPHFCLDLPHRYLEHASEIRAAYRLWSDELSRRHYLAFLNWRLTLNCEALPERTDHYPQDVFNLGAGEFLVDCGAYDGDTVSDFLRRRGDAFRGIVAIEPDPHNFARLQQCLSPLPEGIRQRVKALNLAVSDRAGTVRFSAIGTMASGISAQGDIEVPCMPIDAIDEIVDPTLIKLDIEGAESLALRGAEKTMRRNCAIFSVTTEHRPEDLWSIPLQVAAVSDNYRFFLRPHWYENWDLVCYAVPKERALSHD